MLTPQEKSDRTWAALIHLSPLLGYIIPLPGATVLAPLVLWLVRRNDSPFLDDQGREALNFNLTYVLYGFGLGAVWLVAMSMLIGGGGRGSGEAGGFALMAVGIGLAAVLLVAHLVLLIVAAVKSNDGLVWRYPLILRLVR